MQLIDFLYDFIFGLVERLQKMCDDWLDRSNQPRSVNGRDHIMVSVVSDLVIFDFVLIIQHCLWDFPDLLGEWPYILEIDVHFILSLSYLLDGSGQFENYLVVQRQQIIHFDKLRGFLNIFLFWLDILFSILFRRGLRRGENHSVRW